MFRFDEHNDADGRRFRKVLGAVADKRGNYRELAGMSPQRHLFTFKNVFSL